MIIDYLRKDFETLYNSLFVVSVAWVVVILAMLIDLYFGVKKAKQLGEATHSEGFRRTINKATYYLALMCFAFLFDAFDVITPYFFPKPLSSVPFVSVFVALGLILTEAKSVREKAEDKARRRTDQSFKQIVELLKDREDALKDIAEYLKKQKDHEHDPS